MKSLFSGIFGGAQFKSCKKFLNSKLKPYNLNWNIFIHEAVLEDNIVVSIPDEERTRVAGMWGRQEGLAVTQLYCQHQLRLAGTEPRHLVDITTSVSVLL